VPGGAPPRAHGATWKKRPAAGVRSTSPAPLHSTCARRGGVVIPQLATLAHCTPRVASSPDARPGPAAFGLGRLRAAGPAGSAVVSPTTSTAVLLLGDSGGCCWGRRLLARQRFAAVGGVPQGLSLPACCWGGSRLGGAWSGRRWPSWSKSVSPGAGCVAEAGGAPDFVTSKPVWARPPFRVVTDCKANVKLCILLPSCSPRCPDTREIIIRG
jgi:hypothetical protein